MSSYKISFVMSVSAYISVRTEQLCSHSTDFQEIRHLLLFFENLSGKPKLH
jgi:hypothetical protein